LERLPGGERLGEEDARVDRHDAGIGREADELVDQHRLLLLEGAEQHEARMMALDGLREDVRYGRAVAQTAHSPSPRCTWKGAARCQSMKVFIVSSENSIGSARSRTSSSKRLLPTRSANALNASSSSRSASSSRSH